MGDKGGESIDWRWELIAGTTDDGGFVPEIRDVESECIMAVASFVFRIWLSRES